jgi:hypothetical protein
MSNKNIDPKPIITLKIKLKLKLLIKKGTKQYIAFYPKSWY